MPQMSPLMWLNLFIIFIMIFMIFNILNYFNFSTFNEMKNTSDDKKIFSKSFLFWKW